jgi:hypothetical protein
MVTCGQEGIDDRFAGVIGVGHENRGELGVLHDLEKYEDELVQ